MLDHTYCRKECQDLSCKHNKKHLRNKKIRGMPVVGAIFWDEFLECEKGRYKWEIYHCGRC